MIIKNFSSLATDKYRGDALRIINAGIESVLIASSFKQKVKLSGNRLTILNHQWNLSKFNRVFVVGAGKASSDMAYEIEKILGKRISGGLVIDTKKRKLSRIKSVKGTHPLTSQINIEATKEIMNIVQSCNKDDLVICLISGGGSALMECPRISLDKLILVNKALIKGGADISEINSVRKHLSLTKGGQLATLTNAKIVTLIISDVLSNDLNVIASGPTVVDPTTVTEAKRVSKKYGLGVLPFVETPKGRLSNVTNILLVTNIVAINAMSDEARKLGYKVKIISTRLKGEASKVGKELSEMVEPGLAIIAAGETTVNVVGKGVGGRNQELALSASRFISGGVIVSCSTDGVDFITAAAGGIVDKHSRFIAAKKDLDINKFLKNNDSYNILKKINGVIKTGKTGTNVGDLMLVLGDKN